MKVVFVLFFLNNYSERFQTRLSSQLITRAGRNGLFTASHWKTNN